MLLVRPNLRLIVKRALQSLPVCDRVIRSSLNGLRKILYRTDVVTIESIPLFSPPYGAGSDKVIARLALLSANQTFPFLVRLIEVVNRTSFDELTPIIKFSTTAGARMAAKELKSLFDRHGSDKAKGHDYHHLYGAILEPFRESTVALLEIGLGTNYSDIPSSMGASGRPGASLRAFAEYLPLGRIYGADIDRRILFQEDRISTFFVNQTCLESFRSLASAINGALDVIIDDGLHSPNANVATLIFACEHLKVGGWLVVEDIEPAALPVWRVVSALLPQQRYNSWLISAENGYLFAMKRNQPSGENHTDESGADRKM